MLLITIINIDIIHFKELEVGKSIKDLRPGDVAVVQGFTAGESLYKKKLLSMGITSGVQLKMIKVAPLGDPVELELRGYRLSLRKEEAATIRLRDEI